MKFADLRSIGHNIADSLAGGCSFLVGAYDLDIFGEAVRSPEGFITVDFLTGTSSGGATSPSLARSIARYPDALAKLCDRHGASPSAFRVLTARYSTDRSGRRFVVTIEDEKMRRANDEYHGSPGARAKVLDDLGRVRPG